MGKTLLEILNTDGLPDSVIERNIEWAKENKLMESNILKPVPELNEVEKLTAGGQATKNGHLLNIINVERVGIAVKVRYDLLHPNKSVRASYVGTLKQREVLGSLVWSEFDKVVL